MSRFCRSSSRVRSFGLIVAAGLCLAGVASLRLFGDLPSPDALLTSASTSSTRILDRNGKLLYEILDPRDGRRTRASLSDLPHHLVDAVLAVEDANFYRHPGIDPAGVTRAIVQAVVAGDAGSGGSTITQQLARGLLMSIEERQTRSVLRKAREMVLALRLTAAYDRGTILELYLNEVYFGQLAYGIEAAAQTFFGKPAAQLDLAESALLAGLIQAPAAYDPLVHPDAARARQTVVLGLMEKNGYISEAEAIAAQEEAIRFSAQAPEGVIRAPHFVAYVRGLLESAIGQELVNGGGLVVTTTLDLDVQDQAETVISRQLAALERAHLQGGPDHNVHDAALVALDPSTGDILAMVGSADYFDAAIDGAVNVALALRQPGSAIKPITYAAALAQGLTPATVINDVPKTFITAQGHAYAPENYDRTWHGPIPLRQALATSSNMAAVRVLDQIGLPAMMQTARDLGISSFSEPERYGLALTLGGGEVTLMELTSAYAALANGGRPRPPVAILQVRDSNGRALELGSSGGPAPAGVSPQVAYLISDILSDETARIPAFGLAGPLLLDRPAAVKTGTTTDYRDNWTVGYTPQLAAGVWVGNADNAPMVATSGVTGAAPIWHSFMETALANRPALPFDVPSGILEMEVCGPSGLLPSPECPWTRHEFFIAGTEPVRTDDTYRRFTVDGRTGLLWNRACQGVPVERVVRVMDPEVARWAAAQGIEPTPTGFCDGSAAPGAASPSISDSAALYITYPDEGATLAISPQIPAQQQQVELAVWASPSIIRLQMQIDAATQAPFDAQPFRLLWPLAAGTHTLVVTGWDTDGRMYQDQITFRVDTAETAQGR